MKKQWYMAYEAWCCQLFFVGKNSSLISFSVFVLFRDKKKMSSGFYYEIKNILPLNDDTLR